MAQSHAQSWIVFIDKSRNFAVFPCVAPALVACQDNHIVVVSGFNCSVNRDAIDDASIEHGKPINVDNLTHERQTARCLDNIERTLAVVCLAEIHGLTGQTICCDHFKTLRMFEIFIEIKW